MYARMYLQKTLPKLYYPDQPILLLISQYQQFC